MFWYWMWIGDFRRLHLQSEVHKSKFEKLSRFAFKIIILLKYSKKSCCITLLFEWLYGYNKTLTTTTTSTTAAAAASTTSTTTTVRLPWIPYYDNAFSLYLSFILRKIISHIISCSQVVCLLSMELTLLTNRKLLSLFGVQWGLHSIRWITR